MTERPLTTPARPRTPGRRRAALTLVVLAPMVAEVTLGTVPLAMIWVVVVYLPVYGAGVLLIREIARRTGAGWGGILLLGLAYGLVEEGIALQSLTSPHLYGAAGWSPRPFGINAAYSELNLPYHAVFSVAIPIALVERIFTALRRTPFLRRGGLIVTAIGAVLGVGLLRASVPPAEDPGYTLPVPALAVLVMLIVALAVCAVRLPSGSKRPGAEPPRPALVGSACAAAVLAYLGLLYPFGGARQPAFTQGLWVLVPMVVAAVVAVAAGLALRHWTAVPGWTPRHELAALGGALLAHTGFGAVAVAAEHGAPDVAMQLVWGLATVLLLAFLNRSRQRSV
ncbi:hypothetical protein ACPCHT_24750 [Nucisporomicrobium flavum]|uniref:hypothetical protein n=1 Tax=Nucisporomicrobium flavum TaxID=2785915 RepID=UPI003C2AD766